jgi:hypothetical protein
MFLTGHLGLTLLAKVIASIINAPYGGDADAKY